MRIEYVSVTLVSKVKGYLSFTYFWAGIDFLWNAISSDLMQFSPKNTYIMHERDQFRRLKYSWQ